MITAIVAVIFSFSRRTIHTVPLLPSLPHAFLDALRDHEMRLSTEVKGYSITLVQNMDSDFGEYNTYFEISSPAHQNVSKLWIEPMGHKWRSPNIYKRMGKIFFCNGYWITKSTPYIDVDAMTVTIQPYAGINQKKIFPLDKLKYNGNFND
jgi:hypothetical protein